MASTFHDQLTASDGQFKTMSSQTEPHQSYTGPGSPTTSQTAEKDAEKGLEQDVDRSDASDEIPNEHSEPASQEMVADKKPPLNAWMDPSSFPDGGATAWLTVAGASACLFVSFGWINCVGVFQDYYQTHQLSHYTPSTIAWIPSLQSSSGPATSLVPS